MENLTWLSARSSPFTFTLDHEDPQVGLVEMRTWVMFLCRAATQVFVLVVLLETTVSFTSDPVDVTTLVATRFTGLTAQVIWKQVLNGKSEAGPTWSIRLEALRYGSVLD